MLLKLYVLGEARGNGSGLLANTGPDGVETHLKGPTTVLLVLVGHRRGARWQEESMGTRRQMVVVMRKQS